MRDRLANTPMIPQSLRQRQQNPSFRPKLCIAQRSGGIWLRADVAPGPGPDVSTPLRLAQNENFCLCPAGRQQQGPWLFRCLSDSVAVLVEDHGGYDYAAGDYSLCRLADSHLAQARFQDCDYQNAEE